MEDVDISIKKLVGAINQLSLPPDFAQMEKASSEYDELVRQGLITPRGYSLQTIGDKSVLQRLGEEESRLFHTQQSKVL